MKPYILIIAMCFCTNAYAKGTHTTIQIIMDESGVLIDADEAEKYKMVMLSHLKLMTRKREFANAHIDVISTSLGRTVWSGTPGDLKRKTERALKLVESVKANPKNCNNLASAFLEIKDNISHLERRGYKNAHVIVFSSLIHTLRPCDETTHIVLPQTPPAKGNINATLMASKIVKSLQFFWVSPHQKRIWEEFLKPSFDWALLNNVPMNLMDIERSKNSLQQGLKFEVPND
ncbi:MAG: hypothetical protein L3J75_07500 [Methylococcaceae bacterium]|nr:hypothetical protein [Methylococcaceae bacterium]